MEREGAMAQRQDPTQVHCYSNPSFCKSTEYMLEDSYSDSSDLPPPPQFQVDDLPPPPPVHQPEPQYGQNNPAFTGSPEVNVYGQNNPAFNNNPEASLPSQPPRHLSVTNLNLKASQSFSNGNNPDANLSNQLPHHHSVANLNHTAIDRYCYIDDHVEAPSPPPSASMHRRFGSLPLGGPERRHYAFRTHRYEYIQDDAASQVQVQLQQQQHQQQQHQQQQQQQQIANASRREFLEQQQLQQRCSLTPQPQQQQQQRSIPSRRNSMRASVRNLGTHYTSLGPDGIEATHEASQWNEEEEQAWSARKHINTPKGRYASVPMQDDDQLHQPPSLPERNAPEVTSQRVNPATQKLHEILTTPRKPRGRPQGDPLSPIKSPPGQPMVHSPRGAFTPGCSPSSTAGQRGAMNSPSQHPQQQPAYQHQQLQQTSTPKSRALSPRGSGPMTSTPTKEPPSARRCLPLNESVAGPMVRRHLEDSSQYGRSGPRYAPPEDATVYEQHKKQQGLLSRENVESAFIARTAVVPPLSPSTSEANTTLVDHAEKSNDRKNAPMILVLVGILTCGLSIYLSWTQGRRYYFDSAIGCGACCALAGACRNMRRAWTGLGLAGLAALSCAGLLLLAAKAPKPGTPMHDVTAGALCGVSVLGAVLALLALIMPRCTFGRHRRVHNWIPRFSP